METHLFNLVAYAAVVAALFSIFMREGRRERVRFAAFLAAAMVGIAIAAAWLMSFAR